MQNFVILVNWGDIAPAEYVYKSESYESLIKSYEFVKEMSKYKPDRNLNVISSQMKKLNYTLKMQRLELKNSMHTGKRLKLKELT